MPGVLSFRLKLVGVCLVRNWAGVAILKSLKHSFLVSVLVLILSLLCKMVEYLAN
jgi:hypothetical protein